MAEKANDTDIAGRVLNSLKWNVVVPSDKIKPIVRDGWVTLEGTVQWYYQKAAAEAAIRQLPSVKGVTNVIAIDNTAEPRDIEKKLTEALGRNARLGGQPISVNVNGHTAILHGTVRSMAESEEAELTAYSAPGVNAVENHLVISYGSGARAKS